MARVRNCVVAKADTSFDDIGLPLTEVDPAQPSGRLEPVPMLAKAAANQVISGLSRVRLRKIGRGRIATKWSSIWNTDYHQNTFRSHLLAAWAHVGAFTSHTGRRARLSYRAPHPSRQSFGTTRRIRV